LSVVLFSSIFDSISYSETYSLLPNIAWPGLAMSGTISPGVGRQPARRPIELRSQLCVGALSAHVRSRFRPSACKSSVGRTRVSTRYRHR